MINRAEINSLIHSVKVVRRAPSISHLFFANDNLISSMATLEDYGRLKRILGANKVTSSKMINYDNSSLPFSPNTSLCMREEIKSIFNMEVVSCHEKYLGLASIIFRNKRDVFEFLKDKVWQKVQGWKGKIFLVKRKYVLLKKVVAQLVPTYTISVFWLPSSCVMRYKIVCRSLVGF